MDASVPISSQNNRVCPVNLDTRSRADADDGGFGVASVAQPIAKARANGDDVLQRTTELHACATGASWRLCAHGDSTRADGSTDRQCLEPD